MAITPEQTRTLSPSEQFIANQLEGAIDLTLLNQHATAYYHLTPSIRGLNARICAHVATLYRKVGWNVGYTLDAENDTARFYLSESEKVPHGYEQQ